MILRLGTPADEQGGFSMHVRSALLAVTALALVTGCNRGASNNSAGANSSTTANSAAPVTPGGPGAGAPGGGGAVDQASLIGHWGMAGDCSQTVSFNADGTATATGEEDPVRWTLEGNTIVTTEGNDPPERASIARNGEGLTVTPQTGATMQLTRCAAPAPAGGAGAGAAPGSAPGSN